ncbi:MAG: hypothetical protein Q9199_005759 [Rusavskia elegans]
MAAQNVRGRARFGGKSANYNRANARSERKVLWLVGRKAQVEDGEREGKDTVFQMIYDKIPVLHNRSIKLTILKFIGPDYENFWVNRTESYAARLSLKCYRLKKFDLQHGW